MLNSSKITINMTLVELLDSLGFVQFDVMLYQFGIPIVGFTGVIFCSFSVVIFFNSKFNKPEFDYFKVLSTVYLLNVLLSVAYGFCFTPEFFHNMDSYKCAVYQSVYIPISVFILHYTGVIEIAILLERMKAFNPLIKKHFVLSPKIVCVLFFLVCNLIGGIFVFFFVPSSGQTYYYFDHRGVFRQNTFYFVGPSALSASNTGQIILIVAYTVRDLFTMIVTVTLNVISMVQIKKYCRKKAKITHHLSPLTQSFAVNSISIQQRKMNHFEKNHLLMIIILCFISISSRSVTMLCDIYYLFRADYVATLMGGLADFSIVMNPTVSFFVYYNFNTIFRELFQKNLSKLKRSISCFG